MMSSLARSVLITGASRGIGLEFVKQLINLPSPPEVIIAACRNPSTATSLKEIADEHANVKVLKLDVENDEMIDAAVKETKSLVGEFGLNILINNAGLNLKENDGTVRNVSRETFQSHFSINVTSPIMLNQKFLPLLEQAASHQKDSPFGCCKSASVTLSSIMGSQTLAHENQIKTGLPYRCSKTAVTMACLLMARDMKDSGILCLVMHPGWVQTDMGGGQAPLTPSQSVESMIQTLTKAGEKEIGLLLTFDGKILPY